MQTPLHKAAIVGALDCLNALLRYGADVEAKNVRRESGYEWIIQKKILEIVWLTDRCLCAFGGADTSSDLC